MKKPRKEITVSDELNKRRFIKGRKVAGGGGVTFRKWAEWREGDTAVLRFIDSKIDQYDKPSYRCEVMDVSFSGGKGQELIGKNLCLNSTGMLDKAMAHIEPGQLFQVTYNGQVLMEKGKYAGKHSHTMDIDLVEEEGMSGIAKTAPPVERALSEEDEDDIFG